jgi:cystathionine gamma-synthase
MAKDFSDYRPSTQAAQALGWVEPATGSITPAIYPSTTYERPAGSRSPEIPLQPR